MANVDNDVPSATLDQVIFSFSILGIFDFVF